MYQAQESKTEKENFKNKLKKKLENNKISADKIEHFERKEKGTEKLKDQNKTKKKNENKKMFC